MSILLVDDHRMFSEGMALILGQGVPEHEIRVTDSVTEGFRLLDEEPDTALILLDLGMPGLDGMTFVQGLVKRDLATPFAVLSAATDVERIGLALDAGAIGFVPKSHDGPALVSAVRTMLAGDVYLPDEVRARLAARQHSSEPDAPRYRRVGITDTQYLVLKCLARGSGNSEIALALHVSENTVKSHVRALFEVLAVNNRTAAVQAARELGLL
jgi:DNA-binding NarL/FixJ family response regulator